MSTRRDRQTFAPRLESLEDRTVPASPGIAQNGTLLSIVGTDRNDRIILRFDDSLGYGTVSLNGQLCPVLPLAFQERITIVAGGGNDLVEFRILFPVASFANLLTVINAGTGDDTVLLQSSKNFSAQSQLAFTINGGDGRDLISGDFVGANLFSNSRLTFNFNGDRGADRINFYFRGRDEGRLIVNVDAGADADRVTINAVFRTPFGGALNPGRKFDGFVLHVRGGADNDVIDVSVASDPSVLLLLEAVVDGGAGTDTINRTGNVGVLSGESGRLL